MITEDDFRELALKFPETEEKSHMNHPDFRVGGKIFATLGGRPGMGMVKLTRDQQAEFIASHSEMFTPASGKWGERGATMVILDNAEPAAARTAIIAAWHNTATDSIKKDFLESLKINLP